MPDDQSETILASPVGGDLPCEVGCSSCSRSEEAEAQGGEVFSQRLNPQSAQLWSLSFCKEGSLQVHALLVCVPPPWLQMEQPLKVK